MDIASSKEEYIPAIGVQTFRELVNLKDEHGRKSLFVDKTYFIGDLLRDLSKVILINRPSKFGKTINMSMLQHFLAAKVNGLPTKDLFKGLLVSQDQNIMVHQGKYPVIFITFKEANGSSYNAVETAIREQVSCLYEEFDYLLDSEKLRPYQKNDFRQIIDKVSSLSDLKNSINNLSKYIYEDCGCTPYLLIDAYDTPVRAAYKHGYYEKIAMFFNLMFISCLKDNSTIKQAILTGITMIARESVFAGVNNITIHTLQHGNYGRCFGFTEQEVKQLCDKMNLSTKLADIKDWYNGYSCNDVALYNTWSVMNFLQSNGNIQEYWIDTDINDLVKDLIVSSDASVYEKLEALLRTEIIVENVDEHVMYNNITQNKSAIWSLLLMTGYLKAISSKYITGGYKCELALPNKEIDFFFRSAILNGKDNLTRTEHKKLGVLNLSSG
jgi:hypothetical protein